MDSLITLNATITPFLRKLLSLTNDVLSSISAWDQSGSVFIVYDEVAFEVLLRSYFKGTLQTFIRQLHFYGFSKVDMPQLGPNIWSFSHPFFLRDYPLLITEIKRKTGGGHIASPKVGIVKSHGVIPTAILMIPKDKKHLLLSRVLVSSKAELGIEVKTSTCRIKELEKKMKLLQETVEQLFKLVDVDFAEGRNKKRNREISIEDEDQPKQLRKTTSFESSYNDFVDPNLMIFPVSGMYIEEKKKDIFSSSTDDFMNDAFADEVETPMTQVDL
jgi:hypothetical protein